MIYRPDESPKPFSPVSFSSERQARPFSCFPLISTHIPEALQALPAPPVSAFTYGVTTKPASTQTKNQGSSLSLSLTLSSYSQPVTTPCQVSHTRPLRVSLYTLSALAPALMDLHSWPHLTLITSQRPHLAPASVSDPSLSPAH